MLSFLAKLYDRCDTATFRHELEKWFVRLAAGGFIVHLVLIALARSIPSLNGGLLSGLDRNYLHAVYTPFSFILFYEVLLLVLALPQSHTSSVGKQYEIVSLIIIRRVFKDIGEFRDPVTWITQVDESMMVLADMLAAALMFLLVTAFYRVRKNVVRSRPPDNLDRFIQIKKAVAVLLCVVLMLLAAHNLLGWTVEAVSVARGQSTGSMNLDLFFFPAFFEFMIFTDVFLLIISLPFFERYEYLIRNAGFVISTVLLRFSLSTPKPYDLGVGLVAMLYGLCVLAVFAYFTRVADDDASAHEERDLSESDRRPRQFSEVVRVTT
ncbi:MAG: hypothetical protein AAF664_12185 [Planctomycetota bacterium]